MTYNLNISTLDKDCIVLKKKELLPTESKIPRMTLCGVKFGNMKVF